jgi:hypothetical protein
METTITGIVYLDMIQQFLIPQLHEDDQKGRILFQHSTSLIAFEKFSSSSTLVSQVGGLVEWRR